MSSHTGENEQALRKILDLTRLISIIVLVLHFYYYCYAAFEQWHFTMSLTDRLMHNISNTGLFNNFNKSKLIAIGVLFISLLGARGRKNEKLSYKIFCIHHYRLADFLLQLPFFAVEKKDNRSGFAVYWAYFNGLSTGARRRYTAFKNYQKQV